MKLLPLLLLSFLMATTAQASHECKDYAINKAIKLVELYFCDSYLDTCEIKIDKIKIIEFTELQSAPTMDVYDLSVPLTITFKEESITENIPVYAMVGLAGIGSDDCMLHDLGLVQEQEDEEPKKKYNINA